MLPENIDDYFRGKLDSHETPPADDLWARLQAQPAAEPSASTPGPDAPNAERLDQLFQQRFSAYATPPARELWERLEDEHLRPRKRRPAAWWPMALAAAIALLITAGGAGLWLGRPSSKTAGDAVAVRNSQGTFVAGTKPATTAGFPTAVSPSNNKVSEKAVVEAESREVAAAKNAAKATENTVFADMQKNKATQATRFLATASTAPKARKFAERQSPRHPLGSNRQPDAAAPSPSLVAGTTPAPARNTAADEPRLNPAPAPVVAQATPAPTAEIVPAGAVITVEVRNGATPTRTLKSTLSAVAAVDEPTAERRGLGGRLLRQAGHLVRGERLSLAEATGLPENVTLQATIAGHRVSKSIQL